MDVNEPIHFKLKKSVNPQPDQLHSGNQLADDKLSPLSSADAPKQTGRVGEFGGLLEPIRHLSEEMLLEMEAVNIGPDSTLPLNRYYTISRPPPGLSAVADRAFHDIIVYITRGSSRTDQTETPDKTTEALETKGATEETTETTQKGTEPQRGLKSCLEGSKMMLVEGLFIIVLAGLHAMAWNLDFPTPTERLLWRLSCIGMAALPMAVILCAAKTSYHADLAKLHWHNSLVAYNARQFFPQAVIYLYEMAKVNARTHPGSQASTPSAVNELKLQL